MSAACTGHARSKLSGHLHNVTRLYVGSGPDFDVLSTFIIACGPGTGLCFDVHPKWFDGGDYSSIPISEESAGFYTAMNLQELFIDTDNAVASTTVPFWRVFYHSLPRSVEKLVLSSRSLRSLAALLVVEHLICLPTLTELHIIFVHRISSDCLSVLKDIKEEREALGIPIRKLAIGAQPPFTLYEETIRDIHEKLGPEVVCNSLEVSFDWSPFSKREPYGAPYWPGQLYGSSPGLWADSTFMRFSSP